FMPSAFTPNNDGINDNFGFSLYNKNRFKSLRIYNRYGQLLFKTSDATQRWDGKYRQLPQSMDSYIYFLEMEKLNGERITKKGFFTLIR
ncbi:MAG: T9SS type B sorting domain-containing protein, partial [Ferruginibacter sp.]